MVFYTISILQYCKMQCVNRQTDCIFVHIGIITRLCICVTIPYIAFASQHGLRGEFGMGYSEMQPYHTVAPHRINLEIGWLLSTLSICHPVPFITVASLHLNNTTRIVQNGKVECVDSSASLIFINIGIHTRLCILLPVPHIAAAGSHRLRIATVVQIQMQSVCTVAPIRIHIVIGVGAGGSIHLSVPAVF